MSASQLEKISWASGNGSGQVVNLRLDDHPGYLISESSNGSVIEVTLKDTSLGGGITALEPKGIVRSATTIQQGDNVKIQFLLTEAGRAKIEPVNEGFNVALNSVVSEASAASGNSSSGGQLTAIRHSRVGGDRVQIDIHIDGEDADWRTNPYPMRRTTQQVTRNDTLSLQLAAGGGAAITFTPPK